MSAVSPHRRRETIDVLCRGTVPAAGLDLLAVELDRFVPAVEHEQARAGGCSAAAGRR